MTFDTWIAKILDALKDEDGGGPRPARNRNVNPVELREIRMGEPPRTPARQMRPAPSGGQPPMAGASAEPLAMMRADASPASASIQAPATVAPPPAEPAAPARAKRRATLMQQTATGAVRFARTSDAELARRKAELDRLEAERLAQEIARSAVRAEQERRKPSWVRYIDARSAALTAPVVATASTAAEAVLAAARHLYELAEA